MSTVVYAMRRGEKDVAQVVTLDSGKCIVSWPTSVVVYDTEEAARAVHIDHMGGRGEKTTFRPIWGSGPSFKDGMDNAACDVTEGCWFASLTNNYESDEPVPYGRTVLDVASYIAGYGAVITAHTGAPWRPQMGNWIKDQREARKAQAGAAQ